jgi:hypothetical protein
MLCGNQLHPEQLGALRRKFATAAQRPIVCNQGRLQLQAFAIPSGCNQWRAVAFLAAANTSVVTHSAIVVH